MVNELYTRTSLSYSTECTAKSSKVDALKTIENFYKQSVTPYRAVNSNNVVLAFVTQLGSSTLSLLIITHYALVFCGFVELPPTFVPKEKGLNKKIFDVSKVVA